MSWLRGVWLAVPLLGVVEALAQVSFAGRAPTREQWAAIRPAVEQLRRHDELLVVAPTWADPLARAAFGERLMPLAQVARPDASGYPRAIEVSALGARAPELEGWREVASSEQGKFRLRTLENPAPMPVRFDFVNALGPERASVDAGAPCPWTDHAQVSSGALASPPTFPERRFACAGSEFFFVGVTVIDDENYRPRRCIWAHPTPSAPLKIRFRDVPVARLLRGYGMLPWLIMRDSKGAPVTLRARIGGELVGTFVHDSGEGWKHFEFSTGAHAGRSEEVEFEVTSPNIQDRHFCFQADFR